MGLDMNLYRKIYVKNWDHEEDKHKISIKRNKKEVSKNYIDTNKITYIVEEAGYWRKANAIHKWFVENVQGDVDDCKPYYVDKENLEDLLKTVNIVLAGSELIDGEITNGYTFENGKKIPNIEKGKLIKDSTLAEKYLPTGSGFFFGSTDYDEYYYNDLVETKKILEEALSKEGDSDFEYQSSW